MGDTNAYYSNCYNIIRLSGGQTKLIIQAINADTDGCCSDLTQRLTDNYNNMCKAFNDTMLSMPDVVKKYYEYQMCNAAYTAPWKAMRESLLTTKPENPTYQTLLNTMNIKLVAIQMCSDVSRSYNVVNKLGNYEYTLALIILFARDVVVNESEDALVERFYKMHHDIFAIADSVNLISHIFYKSISIYEASEMTTLLGSRWNKIYESPDVTDELRTKMVQKIKSKRATDDVLDMMNLLGKLLCFIQE